MDVRLGELGLEIEPAHSRYLTSSTRQLATSGSLLRNKSAAERNVSTLRLTDRHRLLSASRSDSSRRRRIRSAPRHSRAGELAARSRDCLRTTDLASNS